MQPFAKRMGQGLQAPLRDFDQLVEGPWPISTSCPTGGLWGRGSAFWRENWSKHPPLWAQNFDQLVEDPLNISRIPGLRPSNFDPSTSLRALGWGRLYWIGSPNLKTVAVLEWKQRCMQWLASQL
jgi:hypothetical protein